MTSSEHLGTPEQLPQSLIELMTPTGKNPEDTVALLQDARDMYNAGVPRFYHTFEGHVTEMLLFLNEHSDRLATPRIPLWAAVYHDAVSDEVGSSLAATAKLRGFLPEGEGLTVADFIKATIDHRAGEDNFDLMLFLDADMAILGADSDKYDEYAANIRREYRWVPEGRYRVGRAKILQGFLERDQLFHTELARSQFEVRARENIAREIDQLLTVKDKGNHPV